MYTPSRPMGVSTEYLRLWERSVAGEKRSLAIALHDGGLTDEEAARIIGGGVTAAEVAIYCRKQSGAK